jgi:DNA invertase Pin-like site-specific DNA recombinase
VNSRRAGLTSASSLRILSSKLSLKENIDTSTPTGRLVFHIFGAPSEFERSLIVERTQAGLTAARARGRKGGRPKALGKDKREVAIQLYNQKKLTINQICEMMEISKPTLYKYIDASLEDIGKPVESKRE